ncbi:MAG: 30S ribosomal protein S4 [Nitrospinae bacterium]|nr:30S ribosomal protein S4 [Nitrospinota bacterium]
MARYRDAVCRLCRREMTKLFLKGDRCITAKCAIERRAYAPGQHGQRRTKVTEYGIQLREKQKMRRIYGLLERQFRNTFRAAAKAKGVTGDNFIQLLERRLDNAVYRLGLASNRIQGRQIVGHRHIMVNGKIVNLPSYVLKKGDVVEVAPKSKANKHFASMLEKRASITPPHWLSITEGELKGQVIDDPKPEETRLPVREQLIVEFYSK